MCSYTSTMNKQYMYYVMQADSVCTEVGYLQLPFLCSFVSFSMATVSNEEHENRGKGRPRKSVLASLAVTVEGKELAESSSSRCSEEALFCLAIPHRLLQQWRRQVKHPIDYIPLLNESIFAEAVVVESDCDSVGARYYPLLSYKKDYNKRTTIKVHVHFL